jgi:hypothetical protein
MVLVCDYCPVMAYLALDQSNITEGNSRQSQQMIFLLLEEHPDRILFPGDPVIAIPDTVFQELLIQLLQGIHNGYRNQKVPSGISHQSFRSSLLVTASRIAEPGFKRIVRPKSLKRLLLNPTSSR